MECLAQGISNTQVYLLELLTIFISCHVFFMDIPLNKNLVLGTILNAL